MQTKIHLEDADEIVGTLGAITLGGDLVVFLPNDAEARVRVADTLIEKINVIRAEALKTLATRR